MDENEPTPETNEYEKLRNEMNAQYQALKDAFDAKSKEDEDKIEALTKENSELHKALLRSAFSMEPQVQPVVEKSEEELYKERIANIFEKSKQYKAMM
jgi:nanoRNase/pAp phosphatase (c-di-AMP/oligoRNAs hydrolase)